MREREGWMAAMLVMGLVFLAAAAVAESAAAGEAGDKTTPPAGVTRSLLDFIKAGKIVGHTIIVLSFVGVALVINNFIRMTRNRLVPPLLAQQAASLSREARVAEIVNAAHASDSMLGRILATVLSQRPLSLASAREAFQEEGTKEITHLQHQVGYIGFIATIAPMLGLLGTVTGMIYSFNVLGTSKGAARPDELAIGVAEALVTTCEGLIVAVPLMFFHMYFRARVTRLGQETAGVCDSVMRGLAAVVEARMTGRPVAREIGPHEAVTDDIVIEELEAGQAEAELGSEPFPTEGEGP